MVGRFTLLAVLVLLQRRVTFICSWFTRANSSGPPVAEGYFAAVGWFTLLVLVLLEWKLNFREVCFSASSSVPPAAEGYFAGG